MDQILIGNKAGDCTYFDDSVELWAYNPVQVRNVKLFFTNEAILGLQVSYYSLKSLKTIKCPKHTYSKMFGVSSMKLTLEEDEQITAIEGHLGDKSINRLLFRTSKNQNIQVGLTLGQSFEFKIPEGWSVTCFNGGIGKSLLYLQLQLSPQGYEQGREDGTDPEYSWQNYQVLLYQVEKRREILNIEDSTIEMSFRQPPCWIQVCDHRTAQDKVGNQVQQSIENALKISKYIQFRIKILNNNGEATNSCYRRYKDFSQFRELLINKWQYKYIIIIIRPGMYVPPLPPKDLIKEFDFSYIETRRKYLEYFIVKVSHVPFFTDTVEYGLFVARGKKVEDDKTELRQVYQKLKEMTMPATKEQVRLRYQTAFEDLLKLPPINELQRNKVSDFHTFLQKAQVLLESLTQSTQLLGSLYMKQSSNIYRLTRQVVPDFQQLFVDEHLSNQIDFATLSQNLTKKLDFQKQQIKQQQDSDIYTQAPQQDDKHGIQLNGQTYNDLNEMCTIELRDIQAYIQCMLYIRSLESKRNKLESKIQQTQGDNTALRADLDATQVIWSTLIKVYSEYYIDQFYKERKEFYYFILNKVAKAQINNLNISMSFWKNQKEQVLGRLVDMP